MDPGSITTLAQAPGQVVRAAVALKKLYDAFFDEHRNATTEARQFAQLVSTFAINLVNQERLISRAGKLFPGEENFLNTIEQCTSYLQKYDSLLQARAQPVRRALEITKWQADLKGERKRLVDNLNIHVSSMNSFSLNVLLEIALRDREAIGHFSTPTHEAATTAGDDQTLKEFHVLYNHLYDSIVVLQNRQKRDKRYERMPDLVMTDLKRIIDDWRHILIKSGMAEDRLPELPERASEQETFESSVNRWRRDIYREQSLRSRSSAFPSRSNSNDSDTPTSRRDSVASIPPGLTFPKASPPPETDVYHSPIDNVFCASSPEPTQPASDMNARSPSLLSTAPSPTFDKSPTPTWSTGLTGESLMSQRKDSRTSSIVDEMRRLSVTSSQPIAELRWEGHNKHNVPLYAYEIDDARRPRLVTFNKGTSYEIEHVLSKSMHPFTKHSRLKRPLEVSFLEEQELKYHKKAYKPCHPVYVFLEEDELKRFQSTVHGRQLLETFEVEKLSTSTSPKPGEATDQHVKLWKSNESSKHYLGYYANALSSQKHRTLLISWFERPAGAAVADSRSKSIRLTLAKRPGGRPAAPSRRRSSLSFTSRKISVSSAPASPSMDGRHPSALTDNSNSNNNNADDPPCPDEIQRLGYVEIHFASTKERNDFVAAFTKALDGSLVAGHSQTISEVEPRAEIAAPIRFEDARATPMKLLGLTHLHLRV